ncbi:CubicO group peptidase (beta-lactamase class C family) [Maribacter vaceletii]|uniref:CubicO group peptidase (Beta-lactamase class C family) n=1 Tax=Maribacter vaceletii TaxID=1206816 RepID=A0A495DT19_9FLAO|nr:serine hydrolase domain-containing protein [Maribacter vaceletii]RKR07774.1 CubicO group peptidase (beta-lactamase class C family) [Maribacter vaceletii]
MKNPIIRYLKKVFLSENVIGDNTSLQGLVKADVLLQNLIEEKKIPGLAITVLEKGNTIFQKGYGYANIEEKKQINPVKTQFRIASVSKPIAATALAHMVADGLINLDASFYDYVPYYPKKEWDFTIRQLASHTAGIRSYEGMEYALNKPYTIKESIAIFKDDVLLFKPGTDYLYNSYDWVLVSLAMQEASGIPFEEYVKEKVLKPLNMKKTVAEIQEHVYPNATSFYVKNRGGFREAIPVNNFYKLAGGGFLSTTVDIANFGKAFLENKILCKETISQFLTSASIKGKLTYYGLGWQVSQDSKDRDYFGHIGNGVGGYSNFYVYPKEQLVFSILTNGTNPKIQDVLDEVISSIIG